LYDGFIMEFNRWILKEFGFGVLTLFQAPNLVLTTTRHPIQGILGSHGVG